MALLTNKEIKAFSGLIKTEQWAEAAAYGEKLLSKDPSDAIGIRYGVMDAYAVLGEAEKAESLAKKYSISDFDPNFDYDWLDKVETSMGFQLAMALWKNDRIDEADYVLDTMPEYVDDYLEMDKEELAEEKERVHHGVRAGTIDELIAYISIPYHEQEEFRAWANGEDDIFWDEEDDELWDDEEYWDDDDEEEPAYIYRAHDFKQEGLDQIKEMATSYREYMGLLKVTRGPDFEQKLGAALERMENARRTFLAGFIFELESESVRNMAIEAGEILLQVYAVERGIAEVYDTEINEDFFYAGLSLIKMADMV